MKLTPWFPGSLKPSRPGMYQRKRHTGVIAYGRWTGSKWLLTLKDLGWASEQSIESAHKYLQWRGLTTKDGK